MFALKIKFVCLKEKTFRVNLALFVQTFEVVCKKKCVTSLANEQAIEEGNMLGKLFSHESMEAYQHICHSRQHDTQSLNLFL